MQKGVGTGARTEVRKAEVVRIRSGSVWKAETARFTGGTGCGDRKARVEDDSKVFSLSKWEVGSSPDPAQQACKATRVCRDDVEFDDAVSLLCLFNI